MHEKGCRDCNLEPLGTFTSMNQHKEPIAVIFSGGIGLGVYQAGAYAELHLQEALRPTWVAGSSIGSVNAAIIAGNRPEDRVSRLRELWRADVSSKLSYGLPAAFWRWDHLQNWASAMKTRIAGSTGQFRPKICLAWEPFGSFYDLAPLRARLESLIDFVRLNSGDVRMTVATTDLETGELVLFDTQKGDEIGPDHLMASCGFIPEFAAVEIDGRLLGDGGLSANAPIEALHLSDEADGLTCFVLDLYARDGERPHDLESAMSRKNDLIFSNQTWQRLVAYQRELELRARLVTSTPRPGPQTAAGATILYLSYRPRLEEAGAERGFDYSSRMLDRRWQIGVLDMQEALTQLKAINDIASPRVTLRAIRRSGTASEYQIAKAG
jgi:NTE family protein